jgi:hypothetical protein
MSDELGKKVLSDAREIPKELRDRALSEISRFSTMLALDGEFAGSGTFITCGGKHGILTANHVVHNPENPQMRFNFNSAHQKLGLVVEEIPHRFQLETGACECLDIGAPTEWGAGPDLSVILLPEVGIGTLKAKKDFFDIEHKAQAKLNESLEDAGTFIVAGAPDSKTRLLKKPSPQPGEWLSLSGFVAQAYLERRYSEGEYDYAELSASYLTRAEGVESFRGMSGGGLWRIPLIKPKVGDLAHNILFEPIVFAGVIFSQKPGINHEMRICCHAGKSIYVNTRHRLLNS